MTTARHALVVATLLVAACTPQAPVTRSATATAAPSSRPASPAAPAPTFATWDGLYVITGADAGVGQPTAWVRTLTTGVSLAFGPFVVTAAGAPGPAGLRATITDDGETHAMTLAPPAQAGAPWRIAFDGTPIGYAQHIGELEARIREHLIEGQRFARIDQRNLSPTGPIDAAKTNDVLVVLPHGLVRTELPDSPRSAPCFVDALVPLTTEAGAPLDSPLPAAGALGVVRYAMSKVKESCDDVDPDAQAHGNDGGAFFFVTRDGRIPGPAHGQLHVRRALRRPRLHARRPRHDDARRPGSARAPGGVNRGCQPAERALPPAEHGLLPSEHGSIPSEHRSIIEDETTIPADPAANRPGRSPSVPVRAASDAGCGSRCLRAE